MTHPDQLYFEVGKFVMIITNTRMFSCLAQKKQLLFMEKLSVSHIRSLSGLCHRHDVQHHIVERLLSRHDHNVESSM